MTLGIGILDFIPRDKNTSVLESFEQSIELAKLADEKGLDRYWLTEHHSTPAVLSSTPQLLLARYGAATKQIKLGTGAVIMNNSTPYQIAENYMVLEAMYPGRIEAGVGHSMPKEVTRQETLGMQINRGLDYEKTISQIAGLLYDDLATEDEMHGLRVMPTYFDGVTPLYTMLGSRRNAKFIAEKGLGMVFGLFFSGDLAECIETIKIYRENFRPSKGMPKPSVFIALYAVTSTKRNMKEVLNYALNDWIDALEDDKRAYLELMEVSEARDFVTTIDPDAEDRHASRKVYGTPKQVEMQLRRLKEETNADGFLVANQLSGFANRRALIEILSQVNI
ncbi:MsnO8 family LLM class oxidoreductase [Aerococcus urinaeequi]|uniref:MsnO8 family LLM class oxidoreductase n=1 Tax=Aerococcus urinaeequi TaxID=51665 RepID=A0AA47G9Z6_9LACT|nr:MsnO8 family LLM class oxidoreductase [Aerococcus urinaeequi]WAT23948.1 MsnO8 family LLM class oxidoreductase [Aerococcus urinaeequi]